MAVSKDITTIQEVAGVKMWRKSVVRHISPVQIQKDKAGMKLWKILEVPSIQVDMIVTGTTSATDKASL